MRHDLAEPCAGVHHHVHGPAICSEGVTHVPHHPVIIGECGGWLEAEEAGGRSDGHARQELVHFIRALQKTRYILRLVLKATILHCKATLGRGQHGWMKWILWWIMPLVQDRSLDLLASRWYITGYLVSLLKKTEEVMETSERNYRVLLVNLFCALQNGRYAIERVCLRRKKNQD